MHLRQESFDHQIKLVTHYLELMVLKCEYLIIFEINQHADEHPECFLFSDALLIGAAGATETENKCRC